MRRKVLMISAIQAAITHDKMILNTPKATNNRTNINFNNDKVIFRINESSADCNDEV